MSGLTEAGAALAGYQLGERESGAVARYLAAVLERLDCIERKVDRMTTQQDILAADVSQINNFLTACDTQIGLLGEDVQALALALQGVQGQNPELDLSGLTAAAQGLAARQAALTAAVTSATALVPPPVTSPDQPAAPDGGDDSGDAGDGTDESGDGSEPAGS